MKAKKRKSPEDRVWEIVEAVYLLTKHRESVTTNDIAKHLNLGCSSHLRNLCKKAVIEDRISMRLVPDNRVGAVYKFYIAKEQKWGTVRQCDIPVDCLKTNPQTWENCCKDKDGRLCPSQRLLSQI